MFDITCNNKSSVSGLKVFLGWEKSRGGVRETPNCVANLSNTPPPPLPIRCTQFLFMFMFMVMPASQTPLPSSPDRFMFMSLCLKHPLPSLQPESLSPGMFMFMFVFVLMNCPPMTPPSLSQLPHISNGCIYSHLPETTPPPSPNPLRL